jgi:LysM repeat protein
MIQRTTFFQSTIMLICVGHTLLLCAQSTSGAVRSYIRPTDSVFLELSNGHRYLFHEVQSGQTLFGLSAYYGQSIEDLFALNAALQADPTLKVGQRLRIYLPKKSIIRYPKSGFNRQEHAALYYMVQPGDNLYNLSTTYFGMPVDTVAKRNRLTNYTLRPGQVLHLGWMSTAGIPAEFQKQSASQQADLMQKFEADAFKYTEVPGQGICAWQKGTADGGHWALHSKAVIGTTIIVENPMSKRKLALKVIGSIPKGYDPNIEVMVSSGAARSLGARDARFFVKTRFMVSP